MREIRLHRQLHLLCSLLLLAVLTAGCGDLIDRFIPLKPPGPNQPLVVGMVADPVFQQVAPDTEGMDGFSRDLVKAFANELGFGFKPIVAPDQPSLLAMLREGRIHMAAGVPLRPNESGISFSAALRETKPLIIQHASALRIDEPARLAGRDIAVLPGMPQVAILRALKVEPSPTITERQGINELELLAAVARRRHDLAASDALHFAVAANAFPDLAIALELPGTIACGWAFSSADQELLKRADQFIASVKADGTLRQLNDRYFGHLKRLDARNISGFLDHLRSRLPNYRHAFQEAQEITGIDWRLLAALAYQESQWDPLATSPTGVRGMMMLTEETADRLGVKNRLDAAESIRAGAKYLAFLIDDLPDDVKAPDRLWLALAAYNLGMGHLKGGRYFAPGLKRDPNLWVDMKEVLPLLARPEYYERLKSGRARGGEAVAMVESIRNYYDVLSRLEQIYTPPSLGEPAAAKPPKRKQPARSANRG